MVAVAESLGVLREPSADACVIEEVLFEVEPEIRQRLGRIVRVGNVPGRVNLAIFRVEFNVDLIVSALLPIVRPRRPRCKANRRRSRKSQRRKDGRRAHVHLHRSARAACLASCDGGRRSDNHADIHEQSGSHGNSSVSVEREGRRCIACARLFIIHDGRAVDTAPLLRYAPLTADRIPQDRR